MRWLIERLIQLVRHDESYRLHPGLSTIDIFIEMLWRGRCLLRAQWKLLGVSGSRLRFIEPGCSVRHRRHLSVGAGSVLEYGTRFHCLGKTGIRLGRNVTVGKYSLIECTSVLWHEGDGMIVGDNSSIGDYSFMGCAGGIRIGQNVLMGQRVSFHSQNHNFHETGTPIREQGVTDGAIVIEDDCWLGSGATVLAGVHIGAGSVVAAGAVVTKSFEPGSVVAGVPAVLVRLRGAPTGSSRSGPPVASAEPNDDLAYNQEGAWRRDG